HGLPSGITPKVLLFAPFNRVLLGHVTLSGYDRWLWGKLHSSEWKEMQLYEESRLRLPMPWKAIHLEGKAVSSLRKGLLGQIAPPGNHQVALNMLRETQRHTPGFVIFEALDDQESLWEYIIRDPKLRAGYWGFRLASLWGGSSMIERVSLWLRIARPLYDASLSRPRMWGFLSSPFDPVSIRQIEELGFKKDQLEVLRNVEENPLALASSSGYLIQYVFEPQNYPEIPRDALPTSMLLYLPRKIWNQAREERQLSLKEIFLSSWGFLDALDAEARFASYLGETSVPCEASFS
ncbi:MAG TPA: hypothetical protein PK364_08465, partial [Synergistaceae bacterium]|nr:hypothetical protein [Synergistaceae bacterium]